MRRCPTCDRTYPDDSLAFCLTDGTRLVEVANQPPTFRAAPPVAPSSTAKTTEVLHAPATTQKRSSSLLPIVIIAALSIGLAAMIFLYFTKTDAPRQAETTVQTNRNVAVQQQPQPSPTFAENSVANTSGSPQQQVETPSSDAATPTPTPDNQTPARSASSPQKIEFESFSFEYKQCKLTGTTVTCELVITNLGLDRKLGLGSESRLFDDGGNEYRCKQVKVANQQGDVIYPMMVSGVAVRANFTFEQVAAQAAKVSLLDIYGVPQDGDRFHAQFRNFPLVR